MRDYRDESGPFSSMELDAFCEFVTAPGRWINKFQPGAWIARVACLDYQGGWDYYNEIFFIPGDRQVVEWEMDWMDGYKECRVIWIFCLEDFEPDMKPREIIHFTEKDAFNEWTQEVIE